MTLWLSAKYGNVGGACLIGQPPRGSAYRTQLKFIDLCLVAIGAGMLEEVRLSYQDQLIDCIMWVLVSHPDLHYYQARLVINPHHLHSVLDEGFCLYIG